MSMLRQGDILLVPVRAIPPGAMTIAPVERSGRHRHILAVGEATGHAHAILADRRVEAYGDREAEVGRAVLHLAVRADVLLEHEEHRSLTVPPGLYRVVRQREHHPAHRRWVYAVD